MNEILCGQLARDYCCDRGDILDSKNHFTEYRKIEARRRYHEKDDCFLKIAVIGGKVLFTGQKEIVDWSRFCVPLDVFILAMKL